MKYYKTYLCLKEYTYLGDQTDIVLSFLVGAQLCVNNMQNKFIINVLISYCNNIYYEILCTSM